MTRVFVLNGVNLGRLGTREPSVYGSVSHDQLARHLVETGLGLGLQVEVRQTDVEAEMIAWLHEAADQKAAVVINPGAWTHYSYALADAAREVAPLIEVHISNIHDREDFRRQSVITPVAGGAILGLGLAGYDFALAHLAGLRPASGSRPEPLSASGAERTPKE